MGKAGTRLGILVGGGPAPGINSAISAVAIESINRGIPVLGLYDGFEHLIEGRKDMLRPLSVSDVSRIHFQGGSILRTSRANPTRNPSALEHSVRVLRELDIGYLVTIGGDDTAFGAFELAKAANGTIRVAHVPKTIDNDLPLPGGMPTFGFETARHVGTELVLNLMEDSRCTSRWFIVVVMGRKAGHLALGIGKAAGATVTIIPEEFARERIDLHDIRSVIEGAILKRRVMGHKDGLAVVAEGIGEKLDPRGLMEIPGVEVSHDPYGNIRLGEIPLATIIKREVQRRLANRGDYTAVVDVTLGYELRCAPPIPFDIDYTRTLGYGAVRFLLSEPTDERTRQGGLVCLDRGHLDVVPFDDIRDPGTGRTRTRLVDTASEHYRSACEYMIRLQRRDLEDDALLAELARAANMSPEEFRSEFARSVTDDYVRMAVGRLDDKPAID